MHKILLQTILTLLVVVTSASAQVKLVPLTTFGPNGDGTLRPGDVPFLTSDGSRYQRGMAYNPVTHHLIIVNRYPLGAETLDIIEAATGISVGQLDQSQRTFGGSVSFVYDMVTITEDGAIYVGNLTTSGTVVEFILYRWASESAPQTVVYGPANPGNTISGNSRWGDTLTARGTGMNTEVLLATQSGTLAAILKPTDSSLSSFVNAPLTAAVPPGGIGYALAFGQGNAFYGKGASSGGEALYRLSYDAGAGTTAVLNLYGLDQFPGRVGAIAIHPLSNLLAAVEMIPGTNYDVVRLYDISTPAVAPVFQDRQPVSVWTNANNIFAGSVVFGPPGTVYALDSDNGIAAFAISNGSPANLPPVIFGNPVTHLIRASWDTTFSVGADGSGTLAYQWFKNSSAIAEATSAVLSLTNCQTTDAAQYFAVVTNDYGAATSSIGVLNVMPSAGNMLAFDPFNYPVGTRLSDPGIGWFTNSATENGQVEAGNLLVPGLQPSTGNRYTYTGSQSVRLRFVPQQTNGAIWFSFAMRIDNLSTSTGSETMAGLAQGTTTTFPCKINIRGDGSGNSYQIGMFKGGGTTGNGSLAPNTFSASDTVFVVARYTFRPGSSTDDSGDLWLNPPPATFGEASAPVPTLADQGLGAADQSYTDAFMWRFASGYPKRTVDEFRLGYSWADVTPPAPPQLSAAVSGANVVVSWSTNTPPSFALESIKGFDDVDGWQPETTSVEVQGANYTVTVATDKKAKLFRLKK